MRFSQLIRILWAYKAASLWIVLFVFAGAVAASLLLPKKYKGEAAIVVDVRGSNPLTADGTVPSQPPANYVATQVDVIDSHNVALKVMDRLNLAKNPALIEQFQDETDGAGSIRDWGADRLLKHLNVRPSKDSNVIQIQFKSDDPHSAANVANAFADSYLETTLELKVDSARHQAGWFDKQVNELRVTLENAQSKLSTYQRDHGVIGIDDARLDVENARLTDISNHLVAAQAAMYDAETRQRQMNAALANTGADGPVNVLDNPLLQNLKTDRARAEARFADISQRYDHNHPQYISALAELESLRQKVTEEVNNANETVAREARIARHNATDLQQSMDQQRKRILAMQQYQNEYAVLKRDAESARDAYDAALQRGGQTRLESRLDQTTISILNRAFLPNKPSWPLLWLNLVLAGVLGPMLAVGVAMIREQLNQRIHSRDDLLEIANIPVLAELPRARASKRRARQRLARIDLEEPRIEPT